jgi:hypothetical protein
MKRKLPDLFWTGKTDELIRRHQSSLNFAYAHHPAVNDYEIFCAFGRSILMK